MVSILDCKVVESQQEMTRLRQQTSTYCELICILVFLCERSQHSYH